MSIKHASIEFVVTMAFRDSLLLHCFAFWLLLLSCDTGQLGFPIRFRVSIFPNIYVLANFDLVVGCIMK